MLVAILKALHMDPIAVEWVAFREYLLRWRGWLLASRGWIGGKIQAYLADE
jgi:hypothetical protein